MVFLSCHCFCDRIHRHYKFLHWAHKANWRPKLKNKKPPEKRWKVHMKQKLDSFCGTPPRLISLGILSIVAFLRFIHTISRCRRLPINYIVLLHFFLETSWPLFFIGVYLWVCVFYSTIGGARKRESARECLRSQCPLYRCSFAFQSECRMFCHRMSNLRLLSFLFVEHNITSSRSQHTI